MIANREVAYAQLEKFLPFAGSEYASKRNYDLGDDSSVSRLSPFIRRRLLHEREIIELVLEQHTFKNSEKFIQEILWRSYWKGWLEMHPSVWEQYKSSLLSLRESYSENTILQNALQAKTGIVCFDAWVEQLKITGFLHNHARMWFASIWIFTLKLPWQLGADFFYRYLLDADAASNTLSWRWVAGLHTKGKHYVATKENISKFTNNRFASNYSLEENATALSENETFLPEKLFFPARKNYTGVALLINPEHCVVEEFEERIEPNCILTIKDLPASNFNYHRSEIAILCDKTAVLDAATRAAEHYSCKHYDISLKEITSLATSEIVTPFAAIGHTQECLFELGSIISEKKINLSFITDNWDEKLYPFAKKGFFDFRKNTIENEKVLRKLLEVY